MLKYTKDYKDEDDSPSNVRGLKSGGFIHDMLTLIQYDKCTFL